MPLNIKIGSEEESKLRDALAARHDPESERLKRFLNMPDLSRTPGSPLAELVDRILAIPSFADFDRIEAPEIVPTDVSFDVFNFPPDHPSRSASDTYFVDEKNVLRTHTTIMWYYHVRRPEVRAKLDQNHPVAALSWGKVYRKDEIDRHHMNVFHQMDGWYLTPKSQKVITIEDLQTVLAQIARAVFGSDVKYRFNKDAFPYTDPSLEMEISVADPGAEAEKWVEILGAGVVHTKVLENLGVDPSAYNGWAFGFGLERLAIVSMALPDIRLLWSQDPRVTRQLRLGNSYTEVSKYPPITRDISFVVDSGFIPNNYFDLIRDIGGDLVEEVKLIDTYQNPSKFGDNKTSYTYRIVYRSNERTLLASEIDPIQEKIYRETAAQFKAELR